MRISIPAALLLSVTLNVCGSGADNLPNPFAALVDVHPAFVVIGESSVAENKTPFVFGVTTVKTVAINDSKPWGELFRNAVSRDLQRDTILMSARTTVLIFLDAEQKPLAGFLYQSRTRLNKKALEPISVVKNARNYSYQLMSDRVAKMQGIDLIAASRDDRIAATSVRFIPINDLVGKYAGDDVTDSFPRSLLP